MNFCPKCGVYNYKSSTRCFSCGAGLQKTNGDINNSLKLNSESKKETDINVLGLILGTLIVAWIFIWLIPEIIKDIILYIFPSLGQVIGLSDTGMRWLVFIAMIILFITLSITYASISIHLSIYRDRYFKAIVGIGILVLAYLIYPDGIMSSAIARITMGELLRLILVILFGIAFIVDIYFLIVDIYY